jgi:hypothetical protein
MTDLFTGLLLGGRRGAYDQWQQAKAAEEARARAAQIRGLLGAPTQYDAVLNAGPPEPSQAVAPTVPGSGLLGAPNDPMERLKLAAGIMSMPGGQELGAQMLQGFYQQRQQGEQYQQTEGRMGSQFNQQLEQQAAGQTQQQQNWLATFDAQQAAAAQAAANDAARLRLAQGQYSLEERRTAATEAAAALKQSPLQILEARLGKAMSGYSWIAGPSGQPIQAPDVGTPDYQKAIQSRDSIAEGLRSVDYMLDTAWGKPRQVRTPRGGVDEVRAGGKGFEALGGESAPMAAAYASLRSAILKAEGAGVLDAGEREDFEKRIANPSNWSSFATDTQRKALEQYKAKLQRATRSYYEQNPWMIPPPPGAR